MCGVSKKAFGFLEIIIALLIISIISWMFLPKINIKSNQLEVATQRLILYLKQTRYQAMLENHFDPNDTKWHKKRWTLKFLHCTNKEEGLYYSIYSDTNKTGQIAKNETLKDPLSNKYIYNNNQCYEAKDISPYTLLTKSFGIEKVNISCNDTTTIGQLSFGYDGKLYSKLSSKENDSYSYLVEHPCEIELISNEDKRTIVIESITGYIHKK